MAREKREFRRKDPDRHHHGELGPALVAAAWRLVEEDGARAVSLRAAARLVGVSAMAPYHHFANKAALLAAVAARGFRELRAAMERAAAEAPSPLLALRATGEAYVVFALRHPELFRVMFGPELADPSEHGELSEAAGSTMNFLVEGFRRASGAGAIGPLDAHAVARASWATMHGVATLLVAGQLGPRTEVNAVAQARAVLGVLREGLGRGG